MAWWDALIDFGSKNADWLAPVAGAAAGALSGGRDQKSTQTTQVNMPDNVRGAYDKLINYAGENFDRPIQAAPTRRVTAPTNAYDALFANPELLAIQQQADAAYQAPKPAAPQINMQKGADGAYSANNLSPDILEALVMGQYGTLPDARKQQAMTLLQQVKRADGTTNKYSGEKVNYSDWLQGQLQMGNSGASGSLIPQANAQYQKGLMQSAPSQHGATYDPTSSWLDRLLPTLALAGITGGVGLGASSLAGPMLAGGISPATAATGFKGLTSLATMGR